MPLSAAQFVVELEAQNMVALRSIATANARPPPSARSPQGGAPPSGPLLSVARLLEVALKSELEATEVAAAWVGSTPELEAKLAFARQAGDEAKHFRMIQKRLAELGSAASGGAALTQNRSELYEFLLALEGTVARVAAGPFTRESLAVVRNDEFARYCEQSGDAETARLYSDTIQPDEQHHHELGRALLLKMATTDEAQAAARTASRRVLELAEEIQETARIRLGIARAPGC